MSLRVGIVGAGLSGALMATMLARRGHRVSVYERRPDPRAVEAEGGRSINLALSHRGLRALDGVGLGESVLATTVPMRGRLMHDLSGRTALQPYGTEEHQVIHSVSRAGLNRMLVDAAADAGADLCFGARCEDVDFERAEVLFETGEGVRERADHDLIVGADGAFSVVRGLMQRRPGFDYQQSYLTHGYKELTLPPTPSGDFAMDSGALHIWPRGGYMMIALPNADRSYTCTLFMPLLGENSFAALEPPMAETAAVGDAASPAPAEAIEGFFRRSFPDALPLFPDLVEQYRENPVGYLVTVRCSPWVHEGSAVLIGDAAHAVVPFYGQGMNASFEDCRLLDEHLASVTRPGAELAEALTAFAEPRRVDTDALADLAVYNYTVMRDRVASRTFLLGRALGRLAHRALPGVFLPLYTMVTFTSMPYAEAVERWARQQRRVRHGVLALILIALILIIRGLS